ncbi:MAG TPA: hypothetical protein VLC46_14780 [Thermoanaerobaculia bacterium]|jgi:hypothetical protein|nr:hypothetical protein [Thermoanaerobaculia bacterium]
MDVDQRLEDLDLRLQRIELRLSLLEHPSAAGTIAEEPIELTEEETAAPVIDLALIGKSLLIFGGAFLLRAATDSAAVSKPAGVAAGLFYAIASIALAIYVVRLGRRRAGIFYASTAAIIAYPIVWEATTRFGVLSANIAALVLAALSIGLIEAGRRYSLPSFAWIAAAGATCDALLLAYATKELIPFLIEVTVISAIAFLLRAQIAGWVLAIEADLVALLLILLTLLDPSNDAHARVAATLLLFAVIWLAVSARAMFQGATASLIGIIGSSALVLSPAPRTILWSVAALVAAEVARRGSSRAVTITFSVQSALWGVFAAIGGGLFSFAGAALVNRGEAIAFPLPAFLGAALCLVAFLRQRNVVLLGIAVSAAASIAMVLASSPLGLASEGVHALVRTGVLAAASVALALIGRHWRVREASQLAIVLLVMTGAKVIAQDLRTGTAGMMFIALAVYGGAMLAIAKTRAAK